MTRFWFAAALLAASIGASPAGADPVPAGDAAPTVALRIYAGHQDDLPPAPAIALTSSLLGRAGIRVVAVACAAGAPEPGCAAPLAATDLAIRLVRAPADTSGAGAMAIGSSLIDTATRHGAFATLYLDRIEVLARASGVGAAIILARALAHETAHLVLGSNDHGTSGLMRPLWSREMLRRDGEEVWVFTTREGTRIRAALLARLAAGSRPRPVNVTH